MVSIEEIGISGSGLYTIERGAAPVTKRIPETAELRAIREARSTRRKLNEHEKAIAAAELERERREREQAKENRERRWLVSDAEWEAAKPKRKIKFGKVINNHFVPQWKLDEQAAEEARAQKVLNYLRKEAREEQKRRSAEAEAKRKRKQQIAEVRATLERISRLDSHWQPPGPDPRAVTLKEVIRRVMRGTVHVPGRASNRCAAPAAMMAVSCAPASPRWCAMVN